MNERIEPSSGDALVVVDVQNDFLPGGALAVAAGDEVVEPLNRCVRAFAARGLPIFVTRDWHPPDHCSFQPHGGRWPPHCIAGTHGAEFAPNLELPASVTIVSKATTAVADAYSGFNGTPLAELLHERGVRRIFVGGLATDYCVLNTVKDAREAGFEVVVLDDAVRAVDVEPGDGDRAKGRMRDSGARLVESVAVVP